MSTLGQKHERTAKAVERLIALYESWAKPEKVAEWREKLAARESATSRDSPPHETDNGAND